MSNTKCIILKRAQLHITFRILGNAMTNYFLVYNRDGGKLPHLEYGTNFGAP